MKKKILLIDDDEPFRKMLRMVLERSGYSVKEAADGREGLEQFRSDCPDLVITDILMPNMEGIETIRTLCSEAPDLPIFAVSGGGIGGVSAYLNAAERLGAVQSFTKPFDRAQFLDAVSAALEERKDISGGNR